eukprot:5627787-Pyramimonas_sp.AAC.2
MLWRGNLCPNPGGMISPPKNTNISSQTAKRCSRRLVDIIVFTVHIIVLVTTTRHYCAEPKCSPQFSRQEYTDSLYMFTAPWASTADAARMGRTRHATLSIDLSTIYHTTSKGSPPLQLQTCGCDARGVCSLTC